MNTVVLPRMLVLGLICASTPLFAQNLTETSRRPLDSTSPSVPPASLQGFATGGSIQPLVGVTPENFSSQQPWYLIQDQATLGYSVAPTVTRPWSLESQLRRNAGPLLKLAVNRAEKPPTATGGITVRSPAQELGFALSMLAAIYRADDTPAEPGAANDLEYALSIRHKIRETPDKLLEIVAAEITANPKKVCEIVKAAIKATDGSNKVVANIVETASMTKPESMRLAAQCAVASVPDSLSAVQAVLAQLDPACGNLGKDSKDAKSSKDSKSPKEQVASDLPNPLDLPKLLPPPPPKPPPIYPPPSTKTNFVKPCDYGNPKCPNPPEGPKKCNSPKVTK